MSKSRTKTANKPQRTAEDRAALRRLLSRHDPMVEAGNPIDLAREAIAGRLRHHLQMLADTPKRERPRDWIDETELRRRAAALVRACHRLRHVPGPQLATLCEALLCGARIPSTAVTQRRFAAWCNAIRAEVTIAAEADKPASERAVATAAFGKNAGDDRRKDVHDWRSTPEYLEAVNVARIDFELLGSLPSNSQLRSFAASSTDLLSGLAHTPGEKR